MSIYKPTDRSARRQSLRLLGQEVLPHQKPGLVTLPPDILLRIIRLSLPRPTSATDPALAERPLQLLAYARVCRYFAHWALPELAGELRLPHPNKLDAVLATLREGHAPRVAASVKQWTVRGSNEAGGLGYSAYHWVTMGLPVLRNLVVFEAYESYIPLAPLARIPNLKVLRLVKSSLESPRRLVHPTPAFTGTFAKLHHLSLIDSQYGTMSTWADIGAYMNPESFPVLTSVTLALSPSKTKVRGDPSGARVRLARAIAALPSLSSLEIGDYDDLIYKAMEDVWTDFSAALVDLIIDCETDILRRALAGLSHPLQSLNLLPPKLVKKRIRCYCTCSTGLRALLDALRSNLPSLSELKRVVMSVERDERENEVSCHEFDDGEKVIGDLVELLRARGVEVLRPKGEDRVVRPEERCYTRLDGGSS